MPVIKCKMCGGDLNIVEDSTVCECEYCGTKQTVPKVDDEKKLKLFSRAGKLLRACEFDKASGVFESIIADFPEEAEAYWGLILCKYGIEYVDDPATGKKVPTCHRSSFESVEDDTNFEQACENADAIARRVYREEARQIETLRKRILEVSGKEEPYDVFISYKELDEDGDRTPDSVIAQDIYRALTKEGYRVFFSRISLEGKLGVEYEPYIFAALNSAKVMIVVGTDYEYFDAVWVKNEWSRFLKLIASGQQKTVIPVYKDMDPYDMPKELRVLAAQNMGKIGAMQDLLHGIEKLLGKTNEQAPKEQPVIVQSGGPNVTALLKRGQQSLEDGEWDKAASFYDQVLSMDAENGEAFLGQFFAKSKHRDEDDYIRDACSLSGEVETIRVSAFDDHILELIKKYTIENYLPEHEVRNVLQRDVCYPSQVKGQLKFTNEKKQSFESNRDLIRARQYAKGDFSIRLEKFKTKLYSALDTVIEKAKENEREAEEQSKKEYETFLASAEEEINEKAQEAAKKREADYQESMICFEQDNSPYQYLYLKERFITLGSYKDSEEMAKRCDEAAINETNRQAAERQEHGYQEAMHRFEHADSPNQYLNLKAEFLSYGSYKDSKEMAKRCAEKVANYYNEKKANLKLERAKLQTELAGLHGLFADKQRRKEVEKLIEWIDSEINKLT